MDIIIIILVAIYYIYSIATFEASYREIDEMKEEKVCIGEFGFTSSQKARYIGVIILFATLFFFIVLGTSYLNRTLANILVVFYLVIMSLEFVPIMYYIKRQYVVLTKNKVIGKYKTGILGTNIIDLTLDKVNNISIENTEFCKNILLSVDGTGKITFLNILSAEQFKNAVEEAINSKNNGVVEETKVVESVEEKIQTLEALKEKKLITEEEYYIKRGKILNDI